MKKRTKRIREGTLKHLPALNQVVWRTNAPNVRQGALDTTVAMGAFTGANYDSVSNLHKDLLDKEHELKKSKEDLAAAEAHYPKETRLLR